MSVTTSSPSRTATTWQRWGAPVTLLIALVAVALAVVALQRPAAARPQASVTAAAPAPEAKTAPCSAVNTVSAAVGSQTHADLGADPIAQAAVAGNARLSLIGGGQYLLNSLGPGTPPELANAVRLFANDLQAVGINALAGLPNSDPGQKERLTRADATRNTIVSLCK